jgi:hypothetical protein
MSSALGEPDDAKLVNVKRKRMDSQATSETANHFTFGG